MAKSKSNQDIIDYLNSMEALNNQGIDQFNNSINDLNNAIVELNDQITNSQNQIVTLQNNNALLDQAIAFIPPDQNKKN
jgi:predicted  nucleic acid-binding Zn-ribbon protein